MRAQQLSFFILREGPERLVSPAVQTASFAAMAFWISCMVEEAVWENETAAADNSARQHCETRTRFFMIVAFG
jgi:hypothetical protein